MLVAALAAVTSSLFFNATAHAASPLEPLSASDAALYRQAFTAAERGAVKTAHTVLTRVSDPILAQAVIDTPVAQIAYQKRVGAAQAAREAYYSGQVETAFNLAAAAGERWIAGLSAFRLNRPTEALSFFDAVANDRREGEWQRAGAAFWAARAAGRAGLAGQQLEFLRTAARMPKTFYGMIAQRQLSMAASTAAAPAESIDPIAGLLQKASYSTGPQWTPAALAANDPRARQAAALVQIGRQVDADELLADGLKSARSEGERAAWRQLAAELEPPADPIAAALTTFESFPLPTLSPMGGFTIDPAMVYAVVKQESRFDPRAVSYAGAVGLMQVLPGSAALAMGDDKLKRNRAPLLDPAFNLRAGQDYISWLMDRGLRTRDLLQIVAAYNGGPGAVIKTLANLSGEDDSLLMIESLPAAQTREYVEKVAANYWTYRGMLGGANPTLDALAAGGVADLRMDVAVAAPQPQLIQTAASPDQTFALMQ